MQQTRRHQYQHLLFWVAYVIFHYVIGYLKELDEESISFNLNHDTVYILLLAGMVYLNLLIFIPRLVDKQKYFSYAAVISVTVVIVSTGFVLLMTLFPSLYPANYYWDQISYRYAIRFGFRLLMLLGITSALHFNRKLLHLQRQTISTKDLERRQLRAELDTLKAQINPHFLFNALNIIYSQSLYESKDTPKFILKLSGLMNYVIYECQGERVALSKEIEFIHNYIDLEQVGVEDSVDIHLDIEVSDDTQVIAPLLYLPLLENAFKHGINLTSEIAHIHIKLVQAKDGMLVFSCHNRKDKMLHDDKESKGIGLENVRKRLELIYPGMHSFTVQDGDEEFHVEIVITPEGIRS